MTFPLPIVQYNFFIPFNLRLYVEEFYYEILSSHRSMDSLGWMQFMATGRKRAGSMSSKQEGSDLNVDIQSKIWRWNVEMWTRWRI
jgi:hypothetical protein